MKQSKHCGSLGAYALLNVDIRIHSPCSGIAMVCHHWRPQHNRTQCSRFAHDWQRTACHTRPKPLGHCRGVPSVAQGSHLSRPPQMSAWQVTCLPRRQTCVYCHRMCRTQQHAACRMRAAPSNMLVSCLRAACARLHLQSNHLRRSKLRSHADELTCVTFAGLSIRLGDRCNAAVANASIRDVSAQLGGALEVAS